MTVEGNCGLFVAANALRELRKSERMCSEDPETWRLWRRTTQEVLRMCERGMPATDGPRNYVGYNVPEPRPGRLIPVDGDPSKLNAVDLMVAPILYPQCCEPRVAANQSSVALEADALVHGARGENYGHPLDDFGRTAGMLNAMFQHKLKADFTAEDVAKILICVKLSRETNCPKRDNRVDIAGYAETLDMVVHERARRDCEVYA